jgi:hypothetical protein
VPLTNFMREFVYSCCTLIVCHRHQSEQQRITSLSFSTFPLSEEIELRCMSPRTITVHGGESELCHRLFFYPPEHPNVHEILDRDWTETPSRVKQTYCLRSKYQSGSGGHLWYITLSKECAMRRKWTHMRPKADYTAERSFPRDAGHKSWNWV